MNHPRISRLWGHLPSAPFYFSLHLFCFPNCLLCAVPLPNLCRSFRGLLSVGVGGMSLFTPTDDDDPPPPFYRLLLLHPRTLWRRISETVMAWAIFKKIRRRDERDLCKRVVRSGYIIRETTAQPSHHPEKPTNQKTFRSLFCLQQTSTQTHATFSRIRSHRAVQ